MFVGFSLVHPYFKETFSLVSAVFVFNKLSSVGTCVEMIASHSYSLLNASVIMELLLSKRFVHPCILHWTKLTSKGPDKYKDSQTFRHTQLTASKLTARNLS